MGGASGASHVAEQQLNQDTMQQSVFHSGFTADRDTIHAGTSFHATRQRGSSTGNPSDVTFAVPSDHMRSGTGDGSNGHSRFTGFTGMAQPPPPTSVFSVGIKPKDPPSFHGRANEDVSTWILKVNDFIYLTEANPRQQVAYAATLLLDAAADWWVALLCERGGHRPYDFNEMAALLERRFGSSTRVD